MKLFELHVVLSAALGHCSSAHTKLHITQCSTQPYFGGLVGGGLEAWIPCSMREVWFAGVDGAWKFTAHERVVYSENKRVKTRMFGNVLRAVNRRGRLALMRGEVQLGRLGRITLMVVFGMLGYVLAPTTYTCPTRRPRRELGL
jgi:hypothetical protein